MRNRLTTATFLLLAACMQPGAIGGPGGGQDTFDVAQDPLPAPPEESDIEAGWESYRASGEEPFWSVSFSDGRMVFEHMDAAGASAPLPEPGTTANGFRFAGAADGQPFLVEIEHAYCADTMSGRAYPDTVTVTTHGNIYRGCGGETASLITGRPWQITLVGETPVAGSAGMTVRFAEDGSISGYGGCNRYTGHYEVGGEGISTGPIASTRRACLDPAANQLESEFLAALGGLRQFRIEGDGGLVLTAEDETEITARR